MLLCCMLRRTYQERKTYWMQTYRRKPCRGKPIKGNPVEADLLATGWINHPSLKNNGLHCVFVQVRKLVNDFSSRVQFSLHRELSSLSHLKQGNRVCPCKAYMSSHNGVTKKRFLHIWMNVFGFCCLQVIMFQQGCRVQSKYIYIENWM